VRPQHPRRHLHRRRARTADPKPLCSPRQPHHPRHPPLPLRLTWRLTLAPTGPGPEGIQRIRHALKILLRTCGLRCVDIECGDTSAEKPAGADNEGGGTLCRGE
jgi:hypothetical protein